MDTNKLNMDSISALLFCLNIKEIISEPLDNEEWYQVERIIKLHGLKGPNCLFNLTSEEMKSVLNIDEDIVEKIIDRRLYLPNLLTFISQLDYKKIRITTKYENEFPSIITNSMKKRAPIYFYYTGDIKLLRDNISIVGLQEIDDKNEAYSKRIVDKIRNNNDIYISNDTSGVDEECFKYTLKYGGKAVLFVCNNMIDKMKEYKRYINNGSLLLMSVARVDERFNVTNCIERNNYICGLSKYQFIISSNINSGPTWFNAIQNIYHKWNKLLVLDNEYIGNQRLLEMKVTPVYIKDILSDLSFDMIYANNHIDEESKPIDISQMSIYEFLGDHNG